MLSFLPLTALTLLPLPQSLPLLPFNALSYACSDHRHKCQTSLGFEEIKIGRAICPSIVSELLPTGAFADAVEYEYQNHEQD